MNVGQKEKIIGALVAVAVILIGGSYWNGSRIEQRFRENVEWASNYGATVSVVDYQRGIFSASARTDWVFQMPSGEEGSTATVPVTVPVIHSIQHGPLPVLAAAARIHSEAQLTEDNTEYLNEFFAGDLPPVLDAVIGWMGGLNLHFVSPKSETTVENITFESDGNLVEGLKRVYAGTASVMLDKLHFLGKSDNGAMRRVEIKNLRVTANASVKDGALGSGTVKLDADKLIVEGEKKEIVDNLKLAFLLENLDVKALDALLQDTSDGEENQEQTVMLLLQHKPAFAIEEVRARWPEGMVTGSFRIAYEGDGNLNPDAPPMVSLSSDLQMTLPRALVLRHMSSQASEEITDTLEGGEENEVNVEKETKEQVGKQMAAMLHDGIFVEKGDTLSVDAHLRNGELNLNGKPQPLGVLFELIPPIF
ncbi:MAG: YdgA family protein [Proteobacteria bacterium]|jgi:uncharacterized protein YdgA (DUF945 family)|nr:YdgA family protein [Pseudomonadota bacterium]